MTVNDPNVVVVDAVVVKGGDGYNVYSPNPAFLPPTLPSPQHYISPLTGGGNVPVLSHWFVCYHLKTPPLQGSLTVAKTVIPPSGPPAAPLPDSYTAIVNCSDANHKNITVTFGAGGGIGTPSAIEGIPLGTVCTVTENPIPAGSTTTYDPAGADNPGVTIGEGAGVTVTITNDFSALAPQTAGLQIVKAVVPSAVPLPASYTARAVCDDGTDTNVTLPGAGGPGTPALVTVTADALCAVGEDNSSFPPGWVLSYSVDGGPATSTPPVFNVTANATVTVTITNDPTAVVATTASPPTSALIPPITETLPPSPTGVLPPTGGTPGRTTAPLLGGLAFVALGAVVVVGTTRRSRADKSS